MTTEAIEFDHQKYPLEDAVCKASLSFEAYPINIYTRQRELRIVYVEECIGPDFNYILINTPGAKHNEVAECVYYGSVGAEIEECGIRSGALSIFSDGKIGRPIAGDNVIFYLNNVDYIQIPIIEYLANFRNFLYMDTVDSADFTSPPTAIPTALPTNEMVQEPIPDPNIATAPSDVLLNPMGLAVCGGILGLATLIIFLRYRISAKIHSIEVAYELSRSNKDPVVHQGAPNETIREVPKTQSLVEQAYVTAYTEVMAVATNLDEAGMALFEVEVKKIADSGLPIQYKTKLLQELKDAIEVG